MFESQVGPTIALLCGIGAASLASIGLAQPAGGIAPTVFGLPAPLD